MDTVTLQAHFDGERIRLDDPYELEPDTKLLVTVLPKQQSLGEQEEWLCLSKIVLARAYGDDEPEYSLEMIADTSHPTRVKSPPDTDLAGISLKQLDGFRV